MRWPLQDVVQRDAAFEALKRAPLWRGGHLPGAENPASLVTISALGGVWADPVCNRSGTAGSRPRPNAAAVARRAARHGALATVYSDWP
jgi:hypothetical protein